MCGEKIRLFLRLFFNEEAGLMGGVFLQGNEYLIQETDRLRAGDGKVMPRQQSMSTESIYGIWNNEQQRKRMQEQAE